MPRRTNRWLPGAVLLAAVALAGAACSSSAKNGPSVAPTTVASTGPTASSVGVGALTQTFVDTSRPTAANGTGAAHAGRSLVTTIMYPAEGVPSGKVTSNARPDRQDGPYPLIVFAHGFGSSGVEYRGLLARWVAAGFVVAAPLFPLTNPNAAGGPDASDYVNQPADMSYVVTAMLKLSAGHTAPLAGLVDPQAVGAAGHSLGGVTTLGLAADTCCHDARIKAAIVFSGDSETFPKGRFDYAKAPPLLFVHGTADAVVPYESSVDAFNQAQGPKGLLSVIGGGHGSTVDPSGEAFAGIARITTDFFDAYLKGDTAATNDIPAAAVAGVTRAVFDAKAGSAVTVPTTAPPPVRVHHATASPSTGLTNGTSVTVRWTDFTPNKSVNVVECSQRNTLDASTCDLKHAALLQKDPTGSGTASITVIAGKVGTGLCDAAHANCAIIVNDGGSLAQSASVRIPITFAAG